MRSKHGLRSKTCLRLAALPLIAAAAALALPAAAHDRDQVYADSFGNLVIESAAGYKRIIVGEGSLAKVLSDYVGAGQPTVEYLDRTAASYERDCYRPPVFVKGRSYMYSLS